MTSDNRLTTIPHHRSNSVRLVSCVVLINLFVIALAWFFLYQDRVQEELLAETRTKNLSHLLAQNVSDSISKIDLILLTVTDEIEKQLVGNKIENLPLELFLSRQRQHLTELNRIVVTNNRGDVLFGGDGLRKSLAERDYFVYLKNNPDVKLMLAKPVAGVIDGVWIQPVVRRISNPDGSFAGVVLGSIRLEHFLSLFRTINVGKQGAIVIRDKDMAVVARYPEPQGVGSTVGHKSTSKRLRNFIDSGGASLTYKISASFDTVERIYTVSKVSDYPLYILVGLASDDYLTAWRREVAIVTLTVLIFSLLVCFASWILISNWNREKHAAHALRDSEEHYRVLFSHAGEGIILMSLEDELIEVNESFARMHGYGREEMLGMNLSDLDTRGGTQAAPDRVRRVMDGEAVTFEVEHYHKEGHIFPLEVTASLITYAGESYYLCFHREITERKRDEEHLKVLSERLQLATSAANFGIWDWNVLDNKLEWDDRMFELYGITKESFPNNFEAWLNGLHPEDRATAIAISQAALNGEQEYDVVFRVLHPDGTVKHIMARALVIMGTDGKAERMIGINWDISERKHLEEERLELEKQLVFAQKLESLGVLAGGIAHDFNNILAIIMGHCYLAKIDSDNSENCILEIEKASQRAAELCRQMLAYAGKAHIVQSKFDFGGVVEEMVRMLKSSLPKNAVIKLDSSADIPFVSGDASQIRQVVMNLIINASEAIGESTGKIRVSLAKTAIKADHPARDHQGKTIKPGLYACLEVTDNGCGMDNETRQRIFEPFYTTKFTGRGLGMSAVLGIIMSHGGALQLFSQKGQGTTFKVYLPVQASDSAERESIPQLPLAPWQGSGTILLAEDEDQVRLIAATMLNKLGFRVIEASNGKEALELWRKNAADITLVLTDVGMPVMNGYKLFRKLKKLKPDLPIIISSGFGDADVTSRISREDLAGLIGKPYSFDNFQEVLKSVLDGSS